jgi:hypothetical protein
MREREASLGRPYPRIRSIGGGGGDHLARINGGSTARQLLEEDGDLEELGWASVSFGWEERGGEMGRLSVQKRKKKQATISYFCFLFSKPFFIALNCL